MDTGYCWTCGWHETTIEPGTAMCAWCRDHWTMPATGQGRRPAVP